MKTAKEKILEIRYLMSVLTNDEVSSDEELTNHFIREGINAEVVSKFVGDRNFYLSGNLVEEVS